MSSNLKELSQPFVEADNIVKTILTNKRQFQQESDPIYAYGPMVDLVTEGEDSWNSMQVILANALVGQITHHRAGEMKTRGEEQDYIKYAQRLEQLAVVDKQGLDAFFDFFNEDELKLESVEDSTMAYFVSQIAIRFLSRLRPANYDQIDIGGDTPMAGYEVSQKSSNWWKNYDNEGLIREIEWIQSRTAFLADSQMVNAFVRSREDDVLRVGHFYAAVAALSNQAIA
ncbi:MAG: hypothetical protein OEX81_03465 [Candidatus Pacebacteria bacterium]|nr:hypothetical protein [Candidatus Paceibacterota bacterium]